MSAFYEDPARLGEYALAKLRHMAEAERLRRVARAFPLLDTIENAELRVRHDEAAELLTERMGQECRAPQEAA